jgi:hypothetical protein
MSNLICNKKQADEDNPGQKNKDHSQKTDRKGQAWQNLQGALLVVEVLHLPRPKLGGLLGLGNGREHFCLHKKEEAVSILAFTATQ